MMNSSENPFSTQVLLTVIVPVELEEALTDAMLSRPDLVKGFTTTHVAGHGGAVRLVEEEELVRGYVGRRRLETLCSNLAQAQTVLEMLKERFEGANLFYWTMPVLGSGRLS